MSDIVPGVSDWEASLCFRYRINNRGGIRTLEIQVSRNGLLPLQMACIVDWGSGDIVAWSIRREWTALPADAWESVIRQYAPDLEAEAYD